MLSAWSIGSKYSGRVHVAPCSTHRANFKRADERSHQKYHTCKQYLLHTDILWPTDEVVVSGPLHFQHLLVPKSLLIAGCSSRQIHVFVFSNVEITF
jgi:hypothetical protein